MSSETTLTTIHKSSSHDPRGASKNNSSKSSSVQKYATHVSDHTVSHTCSSDSDETDTSHLIQNQNKNKIKNKNKSINSGHSSRSSRRRGSDSHFMFTLSKFLSNHNRQNSSTSSHEMRANDKPYVVNIINSIIGVAILAIASTFKDTGIILGPI